MSIRFTAKARRGLAVVVTVAGLTLGAAGCGGGGDDDKKPEATATTSQERGSDPSAQENEETEPLAELKGPNGLLLRITSVERDTGGFVTVNGDLRNESDKVLNLPAQLSGNETEVIRNGRSLGGATLVDSKGRKRYYVLRDTDGRPLTTTGITSIKSGVGVPVFMQFPAPPSDTVEVSLQLPMFASGTIQISG
ncbi:MULTISPECIES: hypothetical protein [unclassified Streptomyces]|uniref:hypothetical protein n=1 Tax=unclassified Streptomyces TaxID=2593676 RepID=UPI003811C1AD